MKIYPGSAALPMYGTMRIAPSNARERIPVLSLAFCSVGNSGQKSQPIVEGRQLVGLSAKVASLESKLSNVWPLPQNLALHVRYQFGSYPCSYNDLAKAGRDVKAAVTQCHAALRALERHESIDKRDEKPIAHLLDVIAIYDKQCEVWSEIVNNSKTHEMLVAKVGCDDGAINPFVGVRNNLLALRVPLTGPRVL